MKVSSDIAGNGDIIEGVQERYDETTRLVERVLGKVWRGQFCGEDETKLNKLLTKWARRRLEKATKSDQWVVKVKRGTVGVNDRFVIAHSGSYASCASFARGVKDWEESYRMERRGK